ncbi:MAG TPA: DNA-directed RNA polymerase subunit omega [bacterium]|nr:DNA-directed RNA polymerase subunit omega [bacterium]
MEEDRRGGTVVELVPMGVRKIGSEYDFTVLTAGRALQIQSGLLPFSRGGGKSCIEIAIEEILEGKVGIKPKDDKPSLA